jgi:hypothetical protein
LINHYRLVYKLKRESKFPNPFTQFSLAFCKKRIGLIHNIHTKLMKIIYSLTVCAATEHKNYILSERKNRNDCIAICEYFFVLIG